MFRLLLPPPTAPPKHQAPRTFVLIIGLIVALPLLLLISPERQRRRLRLATLNLLHLRAAGG